MDDVATSSTRYKAGRVPPLHSRSVSALLSTIPRPVPRSTACRVSVVFCQRPAGSTGCRRRLSTSWSTLTRLFLPSLESFGQQHETVAHRWHQCRQSITLTVSRGKYTHVISLSPLFARPAEPSAPLIPPPSLPAAKHLFSLLTPSSLPPSPLPPTPSILRASRRWPRWILLVPLFP